VQAGGRAPREAQRCSGEGSRDPLHAAEPRSPLRGLRSPRLSGESPGPSASELGAQGGPAPRSGTGRCGGGAGPGGAVRARAVQ